MSPRRPPPPAPPGKRAQLRAQRRKRQRRLVLAGVAAFVVVVMVIAIALTTGGDGRRRVAGPSRTQHTLLFQVQATDRSAISSVLLAHDSHTGEGSAVLVPPQVLAQVPGVGSMPFGKALALGSTLDAVSGARNALADLLSVTIDGSWVVDVPTFQRLVDQEGGVQVTVDVAVLSGRTVVISAGAQRLNGAQAAQYSTYLAAGDQEQQRLARLQSVVDGIITGLPKDPGSLIRSLGAGSRSTVSIPALTSLLSGLQRDDTVDNLQYRSLPVIPVSSGDESVLFRIDAPAAKSMVHELLAQSVPPGASATNNRVLVLNGVGTPGLGALVREKLLPAGFLFVGSKNAPSFDYAKTQVLVKDATTEGAALGARVARALGVPETSVMASDQIGTIADVVVIVGADFKPK